MLLGTQIFHQMSMVTPGAICKTQIPKPKPPNPKPTVSELRLLSLLIPMSNFLTHPKIATTNIKNRAKTIVYKNRSL